MLFFNTLFCLEVNNKFNIAKERMEKFKNIKLDKNNITLSIEEDINGYFLRLESNDHKKKIAKFLSKEDVELYKDFLTEIAKNFLN